TRQRLRVRAARLLPIRCTFEGAGRPGGPDNTVATHLYRIAQEAVSNAVRHGRATRVSIVLAAGEDRIRLRIVDNGIGFPANGPDTGGMGVRIMHYRARMIGGQLEIRADPGGGTVVTGTLQDRVAPDLPGNRNDTPSSNGRHSNR